VARNTARDGLRNRLEFFLLTNFSLVWTVIQAIPFLEKQINKFLINSAVYKARVRPHPFSLLGLEATNSTYTSWESLTDRQYTGRHLPPAEPEYIQSLPEVDKVVKLFERPTDNQRLSTKSTLLFSHFAQWFTDGFLRTDRTDFRKNTSNHEIDLSPLYGLSKPMTEALREKVGGKLKSQSIGGQEFPQFYFDQNGQVKNEFLALHRLDDPNQVGDLANSVNNLPPENRQKLFAMGVERANSQIGYTMLNTLFLREHNRICSILQKSHRDWDDERLFQTSRNIVTVILIRIVVEEYINHIAPYHFKFKAQPQSFYDQKWYRTNWMTVEFNLLYRWHSLVTDNVRIANEMIPVEDTLFNNQLLIDRGLGAYFEDSSLQEAGNIGLFNTANSLIRTDQASIQLARNARLRSYNEYREYCSYPKVTEFNQISEDPQIQEALREVYEGDIDKVELYVGLFAEDIRPNSALPPLIGRMVGIDAFSQALTNPLLSEHVFNEFTFSAEGWEEIKNTNSLSDVVHRNLGNDNGCYFVSMTQKKTNGETMGFISKTT
jgi:prostaglandin-endoperoxide synthase 2